VNFEIFHEQHKLNRLEDLKSLDKELTKAFAKTKKDANHQIPQNAK